MDFKSNDMTLLKIKELTESVNLHWGSRMPLMAAEEAGEFIQAVSKLERKLYSPQSGRTYDIEDEMDHLVEEMGDVLIVIGALANKYGIPAIDIQEAIESKLLEEREV